MKHFTLLLLFCVHSAVNAQSSKMSAGVYGFVTIPNLGHRPYVSDLRGGGSLKGLWLWKQRSHLTLTANYLRVETPNHIFVNLAQAHFGARLRLVDRLYTEPQLGYSLINQEEKDFLVHRGLSTALAFGYIVKGIDLSVDYNRLLSQIDPLSFITVRVGYIHNF